MKPPFINVEEDIGKVVGRRTRTPDAFESGMQLQSLAAQLHTSLKHRWSPKGVYRFKTHEEAEVFSALATLPDNAVGELQPGELQQ